MVNFFAQMKGSLGLVILVSIILFAQGAFALDLTKVNLSYQYDTKAAITFKQRTIQEAGGISVYYEIKKDTSRKWVVKYLLQKGYASQVHDTISNISVDTLRQENKTCFVKITFSPQNNDLLIVAFRDTLNSELLLFDVSINSQVGFPTFSPLDKDGLPILDPFIRAEDVDFGSKESTYHVYQYGQPFTGADPAMGQMKPLAPTLRIDTSFFFSSRLDSLLIDSFYLIQSDTLDQSGITLLKLPTYYPECKRIEDLVGPMQYITTESENKAMNTSADPKAVFERFWINTYGTKFRAKTAIKSYFTLVKESNELFTDYRRGWKTDRGMLYIIFGKPDIVIRTKSSEKWRYDNGLEFDFIRISTLFAPSFYSLKRDMKYEDSWYDRVGEIRKG